MTRGRKRQRVLAYVTRERHGQLEVLVFDAPSHAFEGTQVPAGRLDPGESLEDCLRRELHEETGLEAVTIVRELPWPKGFLSGSEYENHAFEVSLDGDAPDRWEHVVHGDGDDSGLLFLLRFEPVGDDLLLWNRPDPLLRTLLL
jgi:8-oxo-dGTP pyrophosphatase MutT (NUDIX family)